MEVSKNPSGLSVILPPISPVVAASPSSSMEMLVDPVDPMTPRVTASTFGSAQQPGGISGGNVPVPVVTPISAPAPALTLTESQVGGGGGIPSVPSWNSSDDRTMMSTTEDPEEVANETQEAAVLLASLSAIATKEVRTTDAHTHAHDVDGVTELLRLSSSSGSSSGGSGSGRPAPPLPDLGRGSKHKKPSPQLQTSKKDIPILSLCTAAEIQEHQKKAEEEEQRRRRVVSGGGGQQQMQQMHYHVHAPPPFQETSISTMRARAVSIDAVMGVATDLSLPCEPCYRESDDDETPPPPSAEVSMQMMQVQQMQQQAPLQVAPPQVAPSQVVAGAGAANLVSPPSSPAFKPRIAQRRCSASGSPRSADRRKRFLDLHGTDCAMFQLPSASPPPPPTPAPTPATTAVAAAPFQPSAATAPTAVATTPAAAAAAAPTSTSTIYLASPSSPPSSSSVVTTSKCCKIEGTDLPASHAGTLQPVEALRGRIVRIIVRKKFSWKNYPELERFLIANREEYLRHSALNYTVQQKRYNNRLTDRLLQLATEHGYVFDESDFSFVTVRDRIRCYFKSYVQSSKKRGLVVGYAARRAGLLTRDELERSAGTAGRIVVPGKEAQA